jgi:uncharacterized protein (DUF433 family)
MNAANAAGGKAEVVDLPKVGIRGKSHMVMMDKNSDEVAELIQGWLERQGCIGRSVGAHPQRGFLRRVALRSTRPTGMPVRIRRSRQESRARMQGRYIRSDDMNSNERVEINPSIMQGKPVIRGTRIPVELLLRKLGEGATQQDLLDAYPNLGAEDIRAAMAYAADALAHEDRV